MKTYSAKISKNNGPSKLIILCCSLIITIASSIFAPKFIEKGAISLYKHKNRIDSPHN